MRRLARTAALMVTLALAGPLAGQAAGQEAPAAYTALAARAETLFAEGSYQLAGELYAEAGRFDIPDESRRWVAFRLADCRWRSAASSKNPDASALEAAHKDLLAQHGARPRAEEHDRVWAEICESLGDYYWTRSRNWNLNTALGYYRPALDWWAASSDLELARERWMSMVWRMVEPEWYGKEDYGNYNNWVPLDLLEDALQLARSEAERGRVHYVLARTLSRSSQGKWSDDRARKHFDRAIAIGEASEWYDDALHHCAEWLSKRGTWVRDEKGNLAVVADLPAALVLYRRIVGEFSAGTSRWREHAQRRIEFILAREVGVAVRQSFLPGSGIRYELWWRNVSRVDLALYPVTLSERVRFHDPNERSHAWLHNTDLTGVAALRRWTHDAEDPGDHQTQRATLALEQEEPLAPGAYVLTALAGGKGARELVLVTDASLVARTAGDQLLLWATEAERGRPLAEATGVLWTRARDAQRDWAWTQRPFTTDAEGVARLDVGDPHDRSEHFASVQHGSHQAFVTVGGTGRPRSAGWRIYATTDRPAYRPDQVVHWKILVRRHEELRYETPGGETLHYTISGPRGEDVEQGQLVLNAFGSAWGELRTTPEMALGEYNVHFRRDGGAGKGNENIGSATLFRLEEYKLPEFRVTVSTPEGEDGRHVFVLGDELEAEVRAEYYFGGAVSDADVEVVVRVASHSPTWRVPRRWDWFDEALRSRGPSWRGRGRSWGGPGGNAREVVRKKLRTDGEGRATITFPSVENEGEHLEYRIEARVVDASRREVVGNGTVRVGRQSFTARVDLTHRLHQPGQKIEARVWTRDANAQPVSSPGEVRLLRARWIEIWHDALGRLVRGRSLAEARAASAPFPPQGWRQVRAEYAYELVQRAPLATGADGEATWSVSPPGEGAYVVRWHADDPRGGEVQAEAWTWVLSARTRELDYRGLGVSIVLDDDAFEEGKPGSLMIVTEGSGRHVLLTFEIGGTLRHQVLALDGTVRLVTFDVAEEHVPNFFVDATMVHGGQLHTDSAEVVVPPARRFLDVAVTTEREAYLPGEEARFDVAVTDHEGRPVAAEVALAVADEAVVAIQEDYAKDPRAFFFGHPRRSLEQLGSTQAAKPFARLVAGEDGELVDERHASVEGDPNTYRGPSDTVAPGGGAGGGGARGRARYGKRLEASREARVLTGSDDFFLGSAESSDRQAQTGAGGSVVVRSNFSETALWLPDLVTGEDGRGTCTVKWPDSTTSWRATARASGRGARFGEQVRTAARTSMPLIVRLQAPRFLVAGDEATVSALIDNTTDGPFTAAPAFRAEGLEVLGWIDEAAGGGLRDGRPTPREVPAGGQARVGWRVRAVQAGSASLMVQAVSNELTDAMQRSIPVHEYGLEVFASDAGKLTAARLEHTFELTPQRKPGSTRMTVSVAPSIATTMLDALPYLIRYPYGCTEQTLSRFVPATVVAKTLGDLGLSADIVAKTAFGGIEADSAARTHPGVEPDMARLDEVIADGLARIEGAQRSDGAWGWWSGGEADAYMTAYAVWALTLAREADVKVTESALVRGATWLEQHLVEYEANPALAAWMMHAISARLVSLGRQSEHNQYMVAARDKLWRQKDRLNAYTRALFALAAHGMEWNDEARVLAANLANGVLIDDPARSGISDTSGGLRERTAHWGEDGVVWRWSDGGVEATAFCLKALLAIDPKSELIQPAMTWLVKNRRGSQWKSTKDTAIVVFALTDYLRASGELARTATYRLTVNGVQVAERELSGEALLAAPSTFVVENPRDGENAIVLERLGDSAPLYWTVAASFFSVEDPIPARAADLFVRRDVFRLVERPTLLRGAVFEPVLLKDGDRVESGERIEVVLTIEAKNHLEYLAFEDFKPAGLEATELKSGGEFRAYELRADEVEYLFGEKGGDLGGVQRGDGPARLRVGRTGRSRWVHRELRDRKVAFFIDRLPQGVWEMRHVLRAETPGTFRALPTSGYAMYVPEIRGNSSGLRVVVGE